MQYDTKNLFRPLIDRFREHSGVDPSVPDGEDALIGFFQGYRPDGLALNDLYDDLPHREELSRRIAQLFDAAGEDRRPQGGRDAYFVVRKCELMGPERAESLVRTWLSSLVQFGLEVNDTEAVAAIDPTPVIRVLEGIAPKNPKVSDERTAVLKTLLESVPNWTARVDTHRDAEQIRRVFYFVACDPYLRDYLMWPLYADEVATIDPFSAYFELWRHRIKFRSYKQGQLDLYLPISDPV